MFAATLAKRFFCRGCHQTSFRFALLSVCLLWCRERLSYVLFMCFIGVSTRQEVPVTKAPWPLQHWPGAELHSSFVFVVEWTTNCIRGCRTWSVFLDKMPYFLSRLQIRTCPTNCCLPNDCRKRVAVGLPSNRRCYHSPISTKAKSCYKPKSHFAGGRTQWRPDYKVWRTPIPILSPRIIRDPRATI